MSNTPSTENLIVFIGDNTAIGKLSFYQPLDIFYFTYSESFKGFPLGDINCNEGRSFKSDSMFSFFGFEDCWSRQKIAEEYGLENPNDNKSQWFILNLFAKKKQLLRGMRFESS